MFSRFAPDMELPRDPEELQPTCMSAGRAFLVVDDDDDTRFLAGRELLRVFPGSVTTGCGTIEEARRALAQTTFDAIVTDYRLHGASGVDFIRELRRGGTTAPIVLVTGNEDPEVAGAAYAAGASKVFAGRQGEYAEYLRELLAIPAR